MNGEVFALGRFISKATDKCISFFNALKNENESSNRRMNGKVFFPNLYWNISKTSVLSKPLEEEDLYIYLMVSFRALSAASVHEELKFRRSVCYINKSDLKC